MARGIFRATFEHVFAEVMARVPALEQEYRAMREAAEREFSELMELAPNRRPAKIVRANSRFRNPLLVDRLLMASQDEVAENPHAAWHLAECAHEVAMRLPEETLGNARLMSTIARTQAFRGNALRVLGDLKSAEPLLEAANNLFFEHGTGDPLVAAELLRLLASLRFSQRRFPEARQCLDEALGYYELCGELELTARTRVKIAMVLAETGATEEAIAQLRETLLHLSAEKQPQLYLAAQHNLTVYLEDLGRYQEAWDLLMEHRELYESSPDQWNRLRFTWSVGTISRGLGRLPEAEAALLEVRDRFLAGGLGYDAALAGLDLALVYVQSGRPGELKRLAQEMVPVFMAQDVHREAFSALLLFQEAVRQEAVNSELIASLTRFLKEVRRRPREWRS